MARLAGRWSYAADCSSEGFSGARWRRGPKPEPRPGIELCHVPREYCDDKYRRTGMAQSFVPAGDNIRGLNAEGHATFF